MTPAGDGRARTLADAIAERVEIASRAWNEPWRVTWSSDAQGDNQGFVLHQVLSESNKFVCQFGWTRERNIDNLGFIAGNARHIAAFDPTTVTRMLAVIQSLDTAVSLAADANEWFPEPVLEALDALARHWGIGDDDDA